MEVSKVNFRHLRAFMHVAQCHNVTAAAEKIHLSQPAITQAIKGLEQLFEVQLFERRATGLYLTEAGDLVYFRAERVFEYFKDAIRICGQMARIKIGANIAEQIRMTHLRALIAIRKAGSFGLAAKQAELSQSSLHRSVYDLQELLKIELLDTSYKGVKLTDAAMTLSRYFMLVGNELRQIVYELSYLKGKDSTTIAVGSMPLSRTMILPRSVHQMQQENEGVVFRTVEGPYGELLNGLLDGEIDILIGALRQPLPSDDIVQEELFVDPLAIVASRHHPLVGRSFVTIAECSKYPWIAPPYNTPARTLLAEMQEADNDHELSVKVVTSSLVMTRGLLMNGDYLTLISPHQIAVELEEGLVKEIDIKLPNFDRPIGLSWRRNWQPTRTQKLFVDMIRQICREKLPGSSSAISG